MTERMKGLAPTAIAVAIVAFVYVEISLNFTFHWATAGDLGNGLHLPASFHFVVPAAFVSWAIFFALGADGAAARKVAIGNVFGCVAAFLLFALVTAVKGAPDFWAIALFVAVLAAVLVLLAALGDWFSTPVTFGAFACAVFWWIATGLDGWSPAGGGVGNSVKALAEPATAGAGAFAGVLSTPYGWVAFDTLFTVMVGLGCGLLSVRLAGALTPKPAPAQRVPTTSGTAAAR